MVIMKGVKGLWETFTTKWSIIIAPNLRLIQSDLDMRGGM